MKTNQPSAHGENGKKSFCERWKERKVRDPERVGSICLILNGDYPREEVRKHFRFRIGDKNHRKITWLERIIMFILLVRTYIDWGYLFRKIRIAWPKYESDFRKKSESDSQFIECYLFGCLILMVLALCLPMPNIFEVVVGILIGWHIIGSFFLPLRILFVDRYAYDNQLKRPDWRPYSFNRSLLLLLCNYFEIVIGFAYMYRHFAIVHPVGCAKPLTVGQSLYFSVVTITTLGYGDIRPIKPLGKFFTSVEPIMGIILLVVVVGLFFVELSTLSTQTEGNTSKNHK